MRFISRKRMRGQALVLFLGFAAAMIGVLLISFNSGQVTNAKMRAMNAADATAYSGAVWEARTLNFQAYMNRAIVVNEVTIAQSVSLRSWVDYLNRFVTNINRITRWIPYAGTVTTAIQRGLSEVDREMQLLLPRFEQLARAVSFGESKIEDGFNLGGPLGALDIAHDVAKKNGAEITAGGLALIAVNEKAWITFTDTYTRTHRPAGTSGDGRKRLRQVTLDSRDGFSENRGWEMGFAVGEVHKQGGTDLVNYDAWKGLDSAAVCFGIIWCEPFAPMGWGGAQAHNPRLTTAIGNHGDGDWSLFGERRLDAGGARRQANSRGQAVALRYAFPNYRDLQRLDPRLSDRQKIPFAVEVVINESKVQTANSAFGAKAALTDGSSIEHDPQYGTGNKGVYGVAEACVYFERPFGAERSDGSRRRPSVERPSLFNPYWHASLATPSRATRGTVALSKALPPVDAFFGGSGSCS
jgi:hypothetical protein